VKPCRADGECGAGRFCSGSWGFGAASGAEKFCVDKVATFDEVCSGSRNTEEQLADPMSATDDLTDDMVGCSDDQTCFLGVYSDVNPDEGFCAQSCQSDMECNHAELPYCNPRFFTLNSTTTPFLGICSPDKKGFASLCGMPRSTGKIFRVATGCDTSEDTCGPNNDQCPFCFAFGFGFNMGPSFFPEGVGFCASACTAQAPCYGGRTCVSPFFDANTGACSDQCTGGVDGPDTCTGAGVNNRGQDCFVFNGQNDTWSWCMDRADLPPLVPPVLMAGQIDPNNAGDDCLADSENYSFVRCPEGYTCVTYDGAPNFPSACLAGCDVSNAMFNGEFCKTLLGSQTATCADDVITTANIGLCTE
jgi:hypothetical protein